MRLGRRARDELGSSSDNRARLVSGVTQEMLSVARKGGSNGGHGPLVAIDLHPIAMIGAVEHPAGKRDQS